MKKSKLLAYICVVSMILSLIIYFPANTFASTDATTTTSSKSIDNIASITTQDLSNMKSWGGFSDIQLIDVGQSKFLKLVGKGTAWTPYLSPENRDWTGANNLEISVINNKDTAAVVTFIVSVAASADSCYPEKHMVLKAGNTVQLISQNSSTSFTLSSAGDVTIPANFNGVVKLPLTDDGSLYQGYFETVTWNSTLMCKCCFELKTGGTDLSFGQYMLTYPKYIDTSSMDGKYIDDIKNDSDTSIAGAINSSWGINFAEKVQIDSDYYYHFKGPGTFYPPYLPVSNWNWTGSQALQVAVKNNTSSNQYLGMFISIAQTPTSAYKDGVGEDHYCLNDGIDVTLISKDGNKTSYTTKTDTSADISNKGAVLIPANFDGYVLLPLSESGTDYQQFYTLSTGAVPFTLGQICKVGFATPKNATADFTVGRFQIFSPNSNDSSSSDSSSTVDTTPLNGKKALFVGDSISAGACDDPNHLGWAGRIAKNYSMTCDNNSVSGASLSTTRGTNRVINQLNKAKVTGTDYDYVVLHGGVNDAWDSVNVGKMSDSFDMSSFDTSTYAGGLEELFYYATNFYPNAKIGYIINFRITATYGRLSDMSEYFTMAKKICEKWNVPYLDFYFDDNFNNNILKTSTKTYLVDLIHPNASGYDVITPYVSDWMARLASYEPISTSSNIDTSSQSDSTISSSSSSSSSTSSLTSSTSSLTGNSSLTSNTSSNKTSNNPTTGDASINAVAFAVILLSVCAVVLFVCAIPIMKKSKKQ